MPIDLEKIQKAIGRNFKNPELLKKALTHKSYAAEHNLKKYNERMEFLGDSILSAVSSDFLYQKYPDQQEGKLSQLKAQIVSSANLSKWASNIDLGKYIFLSKSEELSGGRDREGLLSDTLEAIFAAVYLDSGYEAVKELILKHLNAQKRFASYDPKSKFQELVQAGFKTLPEYRLLNEAGPDHNKTFEIAIFIKKEFIASGCGKSKKEAHQRAARKALKIIKERINNKTPEE